MEATELQKVLDQLNNFDFDLEIRMPYNKDNLKLVFYLKDIDQRLNSITRDEKGLTIKFENHT